jgi:hypothetical protein
MSRFIQLGGVQIPLEDYVTQGTAILGTRGAGKTYTGKGVAEQLMDYGIPLLIFDCVGMWRWLKVPRAGGSGFPVVVAGGATPDVPLTPANAPEIVRAAIRGGVSLVIDLYDPNLSKADWRRIVRTCCRTLMFENRGFRHVFLEEAPEYAPQKVLDGETYAEVEKLVRMGGNASVGVTMLTQRPQELNKAVLELCENLFVMRQRGRNAIDNIGKWLDMLSPAKANEVIASLTNLEPGEGWLFDAANTEPQRTRGPQILSHHPDRKKPELGSGLMAVDVAQFVATLQEQLPVLEQEAAENDPKALRARIRELEREREAGQHQDPIVTPRELERQREAHQAGFTAGMAEGREQGRRELAAQVGDIFRSYSEQVQQLLATVHAMMPSAVFVPQGAKAGDKIPLRHPLRGDEPMDLEAEMKLPPFNLELRSDRIDRRKVSDLPPVQQRILNAVAELEQMGAATPKRELVCFLAGYSNTTSTGFAKALSALSSGGYVTYPPGGLVAITNAGAKLAQPPPKPRTPAEMQARIVQLLEPVCGRILEPLVKVYPRSLARDEAARRAGYSNVTSTGFAKALSRLSSLGFVRYPEKGRVAAAPVLFLEAG